MSQTAPQTHLKKKLKSDKAKENESLPQFISETLSRPKVISASEFGLLPEHNPALIIAENVFTVLECDWIIKLGLDQGVSQIQTNKHGENINAPEIRSDWNVGFHHNGLYDLLVHRLKKCVPLSLDTFYDRDTTVTSFFVGLNPLLRFNVYKKGGHFSPHVDGIIQKELETSKLTMIVYLNDVKDNHGGATKLMKKDGGDILIQPTVGKVVLFDQRILHEGLLVLSNEKYTLRTDVMYREVDTISINVCGICLDYFSQRNSKKVVRLCCSHCYHHSCLEKWIQENRQCPTCRKILPTNEILGLGLSIHHRQANRVPALMETNQEQANRLLQQYIVQQRQNLIRRQEESNRFMFEFSPSEVLQQQIIQDQDSNIISNHQYQMQDPGNELLYTRENFAHSLLNAPEATFLSRFISQPSGQSNQERINSSRVENTFNTLFTSQSNQYPTMD